MIMHPETHKRVAFNGARGLVFIGNKILVYRRDTRTTKFPLCIALPGGGKEGNETPFETFKRELFEEFSVTIDKDDIQFSEANQSADEPQKQSFFLVTKALDVATIPELIEKRRRLLLIPGRQVRIWRHFSLTGCDVINCIICQASLILGHIISTCLAKCVHENMCTI